MFCSPHAQGRIAMNQSLRFESTHNKANSNNNTNRSFSESARWNMNVENQDLLNFLPTKNEPVLPIHDERTSVQLTPFHTPIVKSKTRSLTASHTNTNSFMQTQNNHGNVNEHNQDNSPLFSSTRIMEETQGHQQPPNSSHHSNPQNNHHHHYHHYSHNELAPINENPQQARVNVFSRLTNPKHFIGTARNRVQELKALKEKVRKQKESHTQLQRKGNWQKQPRKSMLSPPNDAVNPDFHFNCNDNMQLNSNTNTNINGNRNAFEEERAHLNENDSVFERLHATSIRNSRHTANSSLNNSFQQNQDLNSSYNLDTQHEHQSEQAMISSEPARIINANEMQKKPQRNAGNNHDNNGNAKSMLMNPVRLNPEDM
eukprot:CAMPEP_0197023308 /NCGR_PEP_ID=MMETSP1384-20130603/4034_1 /TAXON_ID=29189 /ORGANISM="Ammonia sp." /LENGTH=371 /DNA_ID=CAMNT_0042451503 /DNA_START=1 /DNA_END=1116 /DNA_ORIENTATION=-